MSNSKYEATVLVESHTSSGGHLRVTPDNASPDLVVLVIESGSIREQRRPDVRVKLAELEAAVEVMRSIEKARAAAR